MFSVNADYQDEISPEKVPTDNAWCKLFQYLHFSIEYG